MENSLCEERPCRWQRPHHRYYTRARGESKAPVRLIIPKNALCEIVPRVYSVIVDGALLSVCGLEPHAGEEFARRKEVFPC